MPRAAPSAGAAALACCGGLTAAARRRSPSAAMRRPHRACCGGLAAAACAAARHRQRQRLSSRALVSSPLALGSGGATRACRGGLAAAAAPLVPAVAASPPRPARPLALGSGRRLCLIAARPWQRRLPIAPHVCVSSSCGPGVSLVTGPTLSLGSSGLSVRPLAFRQPPSSLANIPFYPSTLGRACSPPRSPRAPLRRPPLSRQPPSPPIRSRTRLPLSSKHSHLKARSCPRASHRTCPAMHRP